MNATDTRDQLSWMRSAGEGRTFFSQSIFRSPKFLGISGFLVFTIVIDSFILLKNWGRIHPWLASLLIMFGLGGVVIPWLWAVSCHNQVHEFFPIGNAENLDRNDPLNSAIVAAATMTLDALFICFTTIFILLCIIGYLFAGGPILTH